ncbi:hypothetical protein ACOSP7_021190 [Xanthoceras sorbifolium]
MPPVVDNLLSTTGPKMSLTFYFFFLPLIAAPLHPCSLTPQQPRLHSLCATSPCETSPCAPAPLQLRPCSTAIRYVKDIFTSLLLNTNTASRYIYIYR